MSPLDLVATAERLHAASGKRRPRQTDLRRAVSTAYYATFHELCRSVADAFVGVSGKSRMSRAWTQAYRSVDHRYAKGQCQNKNVLGRFPPGVQDFANAFIELQIERERADYDPAHRVTRTQVATLIGLARAAIMAFRACEGSDRRAFAVWIALKERR